MSHRIIDTLLNRRSIRIYSKEAIAEDSLRLILEAATRAPNAGGLQNYSLLLIEELAQLQSLELEAPLAILALVDLARTEHWLNAGSTPFHFDGPSSYFMALWDAHIALHTAAIAAESLGLGTLYIGDVLGWDVQKLFDAPPRVAPAGLLLIGHAAESPPCRSRLPLNAILHRNKYRPPTDEELAAWYSEKDLELESLPEPIQQQLAELGITNRAQEIAIDCYPEAFLCDVDQLMSAALQASVSRLPTP